LDGGDLHCRVWRQENPSRHAASLVANPQVDQVKAAATVLHGANDTNIPVVEAKQVDNNLKQRGIPVQYILFPDEGMAGVRSPIRSTVEITRWFVKYLRAPKQTAVK
jgi:dipeptidyl aminopeptidase/acylaminoacyl peptidase